MLFFSLLPALQLFFSSHVDVYFSSLCALIISTLLTLPNPEVIILTPFPSPMELCFSCWISLLFSGSTSHELLKYKKTQTNRKQKQNTQNHFLFEKPALLRHNLHTREIYIFKRLVWCILTNECSQVTTTAIKREYFHPPQKVYSVSI